MSFSIMWVPVETTLVQEMALAYICTCKISYWTLAVTGSYSWGKINQINQNNDTYLIMGSHEEIVEIFRFYPLNAPRVYSYIKTVRDHSVSSWDHWQPRLVFEQLRQMNFSPFSFLVFLVSITCFRSRCGSVSIVFGYGLDDRAIQVRSPAGAKDFSSNLWVQTGSGAPPASCTMGTGGPFPGGKSAAGAW
jgi:hypothetical protein